MHPLDVVALSIWVGLDPILGQAKMSTLWTGERALEVMDLFHVFSE